MGNSTFICCNVTVNSLKFENKKDLKLKSFRSFVLTIELYKAGKNCENCELCGG